MLKYTICFIKRHDKILMLNREFPNWMGVWNGVGGKLEKDETPEACVLREIKEETGIELSNKDVTYKGKVIWEVDQFRSGGMYAFIAELPDTYDYPTPAKKAEGILDWKKIDWLLHPENAGVANVKYFLEQMLYEKKTYNHQFIYTGNQVEAFTSIPLEKVEQ